MPPPTAEARTQTILTQIPRIVEEHDQLLKLVNAQGDTIDNLWVLVQMLLDIVPMQSASARAERIRQARNALPRAPT